MFALVTYVIGLVPLIIGSYIDITSVKSIVKDSDHFDGFPFFTPPC